MKTPQNRIVAIFAFAMLVATFSAVQAEDKDGWTDVAEFSLVATGGNAESTSFGFKNEIARSWDKSGIVFKMGGIRVETTTKTVTAAGVDQVDFAFTETDESDTTAENYYFNGRYDRAISDRTFWYSGAGWDRNRLAGVDNRYYGEAGVGNNWHDTDDMKFSTFYGLTFTKQEDVFEHPDPALRPEDSFAGLRAGWDYLNKLSESTTFTNSLVFDENLDETSDWRGDMLFGLSTSMSEKLALKLGLRLLYDNEPSLQEVFVNDDPLLPVGFVLDEMDTIFTASLVVNFM